MRVFSGPVVLLYACLIPKMLVCGTCSSSLDNVSRIPVSLSRNRALIGLSNYLIRYRFSGQWMHAIQVPLAGYGHCCTDALEDAAAG